MRTLLRSISFTLGLAVAAMASGTGMTPDPTGLWYDPAQPGWGLSIAQQGDTLFVVLFVYDANHNPQWFAASNVTSAGDGFAGPLYRTTGPAFSSSADTALGVTAVGTIRLAYLQPAGNLALDYTIDGTSVAKTIQPQTWGSNAGLLRGLYSGGLLIAPDAGCDVPAPLQHVTSFILAPGSSPDSISITWGTGIDTACQVNGTYAQRGQLGTLSGPILCGPIPNFIANVGTLAISQMAISPQGFSGLATYSNGSCTTAGSIGGVKP
jgi:hypothetical protein